MKVLATISNMTQLAAVLDLESGTIESIPIRPEFIDPTVPEDRFPCTPFGITWDSTNTKLFVSNNRQLLVYDRNFQYRETLSTPLHMNVHQLGYHDGCVWAASPRTNSLIGIFLDGSSAVELDIFRQRLIPYVPRDSADREDLKHVNSLLWAHDALYVAAHNFGSSFIVSFDKTTFRLSSITRDVGGSIHGVAQHEGELFWIDTEGHAVRSSGGLRVPLTRQGFGRGFAMSKDYFVVGISRISDRALRAAGDAYVHLIDRTSRTMISEHHISDCGNIHDLRLIDEFDFAHGVQPFLSPQAAGLGLTLETA